MKTNTIPPRNRRMLPGIDGLRGIAILGVVLYHLFPQTVKGGFIGVVIFFVLSGYLITDSSEKSWAQDNFAVGAFYKRRLTRLYPKLVVVLAITVAFMTLFDPKLLGGMRSELASVVLGYNNWWQIAKNSSYFERLNNSSPFTHLWYLAIELQFYLVWPLVYKAVRSVNSKVLNYIAVLTVGVLALASWGWMCYSYDPLKDPTRVYYGTDTRIFSVLLGVWLRLMQSLTGHRILSRLGVNLSRFVVFISTAGLLGMMWIVDAQNPLTYYLYLFLASLLFLIILWGAACPQLAVGRCFQIPPLVWLGKLSYEIYLVHYPVMLFYSRYISEDKTWQHILIQTAFILTISGVIHIFFKNSVNYPKLNTAKKVVGYAILAALLALSACGLAKAPETNLTADQQVLKKELATNQQFLQEQLDARKTAQTKPAPDPKPEPPEEKPASPKPIDMSDITAIGDSVMLGAAVELQNAIPDLVIDAKESRQVWDTLALLDELNQQGLLGQTVIIALGTNGSFSKEYAEDIISYLGKDRQIFWMNAHGDDLSWTKDVNATIDEIAKTHDNVYLLDWNTESSPHPEWFYDDGLHLNGEGRQGYAQFVKNSLSANN